jgi:hydroxyacylglutathione hydrolase
VEIHRIRTSGLGDTTYLVTHAGAALLIDPQRDVDRFLAAVDDAGARLQYVLETHLHNDYISGGRDVARRTGAGLVLPAAAGAAFDHIPAFHQEDLPTESGLIVRPIHTPGHTPEHVSYLVLVDGEPLALFSGGSLLVGSAGRTDLLGAQRARQLAILQYGSLRRLAGLPDGVGVYPTHGAGSFCTASGAGQTASTIGMEKDQNPALLATDADEFARTHLAGLQPYPRYYARMGLINLMGPTPLPQREVPTIEPVDVARAAETIRIVDARPRERFAAGHVPGSLGIELDEQFGVWVGWLLPFNAPVMLVLDDDQDASEAIVQLARIGFDDVRGILHGLEGWRHVGYELSGFRTVDVDSFVEALLDGRARQVLDVRAPAEWQEGHVQSSLHTYVPDLAEAPPSELDRDEPVWVACGAGYRATIAGSLLQRAGFEPIVLSRGGVPDLLAHIAARNAA